MTADLLRYATRRLGVTTSVGLAHFLCAVASLVGCGGAATLPERPTTVEWPAIPERPAPPPNIVLVVADDQGWGDLSGHGNPNLHTPHLDALAAGGLAFANLYVSAVCSPTRAELLTGRHALEVGVTGTGGGEERLDPDVLTLPELFAAAGYRTGLFGKWHNGTQPPLHPLSRGFDTFFGFTSGHWGSYFDAPLLEDGDTLVSGWGYLPDELTTRVIDFLGAAAAAGQPSLTFLTFPTPHSPMQVPDRWFDPVAARPLDSVGRADQGPEDPQFTRAALAMVENLDWNVGRVLAALDSLGIAGETLVVYFSDNGPNSWRWNAGMRGRKGSVDEGGVRSPLVLRQPGRLAPGRTDAVASVRDLLPTLATYAGLEQALPAGLTGRDLLDVSAASAASAGSAPAASLAQWGEDVSVRTDRYRLDAQGRLYDMVADPGQRHDLAAALPARTDSLRRIVVGFRESVVRPHLHPDTRPFTVGHPSGRRTLLPARDATATGTIARSSRHPNCSYFTAWTDTSDYVRWPVEVVTAGRYRATLYYTLAPADTGVSLSLSFGDARLERTVREAWDPPVLGAEHDRVPRDESYVKDFRPLVLGELELPAGTDTLRLRSAGINGASVEVRMVVLEHPIP